MNNDDLDKDLDELISDSRTLFGDVEEMDKEEIFALLNASGATADTVRDQMYAQIDSLVREMRMQGLSPPQRYLDVLDQLRPATQIPRNPKALLQHARRCVAGLLQGPGVGGNTKVQFSFHRKGDLSSQDEQILRETEDRLRRKIEGQKNE
jgi:hypothetical protein